MDINFIERQQLQINDFIITVFELFKIMLTNIKLLDIEQDENRLGLSTHYT